MFPYMEDSRHSSGRGVPPFIWHAFDESKPFYIPSCGNLKVLPLPVEHGRDHAPVRRPYICMGFRMNDFSYISDASFISEDTRRKMDGTRILVLNSLRQRPHSSHFTFDQVSDIKFAIAKQLGKRICEVYCSATGSHLFYRFLA